MIEILKQTIESSLFKSYLGPLIQNQKYLYIRFKCRNLNYSKDTTILEVVVDIATLRSKIEQLQNNLESLNKENDILKKTNNEMNIRKEKIKESLDMGIRELEEAKEKVKILEQEREELNEALYELKQYSDKLELNNDALMKNSFKAQETKNKKTIDRDVSLLNYIRMKIKT